MRFISKHPRYSFQAQAISMQVLSTPQGAIQVPALPMILCPFEQGGLSPWEIELGLKSFHFAGMPDSEAVPKENRLSVFDTETWQLSTGADDDMREFVEHRLKSDPMYGQDYIAADELQRTPPWPAYDKVGTVELLFEMLELLGYGQDGGPNAVQEIEDIRLYEHQNQKRPEFLKALEDRQVELSGGSVPVERQEEVILA